MTEPTFGTLGPEGSNHDLVLRAHLKRNGITARIVLFESFESALEACTTGAVDRLFICAAHGQCADVIGKAQYSLGLKITDVFLVESQPLAILHRVENPKSIALHPATRSYADLDGYDEVIEVASTVAAAEGLQAGTWDAALTAERFAGNGLTIAQAIAPPRDAWLVLGGPETVRVWTLEL